MRQALSDPQHHLADPAWRFTPEGAPRGYIDPGPLRELWFHTGTICNLACPFCLEGSKPGDGRLEQPRFEEVRPLMDAALTLGVEQFSFTGGEPFVNRDVPRMLAYGLEYVPCLVLTNGTAPLRKRLDAIAPLRHSPHPLRFRVSLDHPDPAAHDAARGVGTFELALDTLGQLHQMGFRVSVARLAAAGEDAAAVDAAYRPYFEQAGIPADAHITTFPDFHPPRTPAGVPHITESCMTTYHTAESRARFMCHFSKMVVKQAGRMRVYACTLVDDDDDYDLGGDLEAALRYRIMLRHHRCFSCFACGASCSEP